MDKDRKSLIIKRIVTFVSFVIVLFCALAATYNVLKWKDTTGEYRSTTEQLYNTDKDLIDVVFMGSSMVYCDVYPCFLWEKAGISAFDMTISSMDKDSSYHYLKELLKTQSPKVVFVDVYGLIFDEQLVKGNVYRNLLSMKPSVNSISLINDYFRDTDEDLMNYYARWPIFHTRYKELKRYDYNENPLNDYLRGEVVAFHIAPTEPFTLQGMEIEPAELSERNLEWLENLQKLAQEYDFKLVLIKTPFYSTVVSQSYMEAAAIYARDHSIDFFDLNKMYDQLELDVEVDFIDGNHTNARGARKISGFFCKYLENNYNLEDHRGDSKYWQWDEDLKFYYHEEFKDHLANCTNLYQLTNLLMDEQFKDFTAIISVENNCRNEDYYDSFRYLGMNHDDFLDGGKWIYKDGKLQLVMVNDTGDPGHVLNLNKYDTLNIKFNGNGAKENITLNSTDYSNWDYEITVIIYDNLTEEMTITSRY